MKSDGPLNLFVTQSREHLVYFICFGLLLVSLVLWMVAVFLFIVTPPERVHDCTIVDGQRVCVISR